MFLNVITTIFYFLINLIAIGVIVFLGTTFLFFMIMFLWFWVNFLFDTTVNFLSKQ